MKTNIIIIFNLVILSAFANQSQLSDFDMSEIMGGASYYNSCGSNSYACPYQEPAYDTREECLNDKLGTYYCMQWKTYKQCSSVSNKCDLCVNGSIGFCQSYSAKAITWVPTVWGGYCSFSSVKKGNCSGNGFPKLTCE